MPILERFMNKNISKRVYFTWLLSVLFVIKSAYAEQVIALYGDEKPPYSKVNNLKEYEGDCWGAVCVYDVTKPTLTLFKPTAKSNGAAVIVIPGGGYETEAIYHEGFDVAKQLASQGTLAAVLKYRLPNPLSATKPELVAITDLRKAMALLRKKQQLLNIDPGKIGVMGFSAGSHLATVASVNLSDNSDENPNFSLLIYGVTKLNAENKKWLEETLYHRPMTEQEVIENRLLNRVSKLTPPAFLVHAMDDDICHYTETTLYAQALTEKGVAAEMHLFPNGGHGFGSGHVEHGTKQWLSLANNWIKRFSHIVKAK